MMRSRVWDAAAQFRTIRVRLTLWYVGLLGLGFLLFGAFLYLNLARSLHQQIGQQVQAEANRVLSTMDMENGLPSLSGALDQLSPGLVVVLYSPDGQVLDSSGAHQALPALPAALSQARRGAGSLETARARGGSEWQVVTAPVYDNRRLAGILQVGQAENQADSALGQMVTFMGIAVPLVLALAVLGGMFLASHALDPIDRVTCTAQRIEAQDLSERLRLPDSGDEVGRLATTFDQMLDRLERAFQRQRQFTADASHELRTPLAMLAGRAELALERSRREPEYRQALREIQQDAQRMSQLLAELLTLARAESGQEEIEREPVALDELAADVTEAMALLAEGRHVELTVGDLVPCVVSGDETRLSQLVVNLIDNATKYTPPGGRISVEVRHSEEWALLSVADTGIGIEPEHLPHVFERFYRADEARARRGGGTGLGLAIADWIARAHGGRIDVSSTVGAGTTFTVRLPLGARVGKAA